MGTLRRDGASVFASGYQYGLFPSVSAAWRISGEKFMKGVTFINDLKLRYSWGKLGSYANVRGGNAYTLYAQSPGRSFYDWAGTSTNPAGGIYNNQIGNPSTTWESDIISNVGLDATLFHNKIDMSVEWFKKKVSGLLFSQQASNIVVGGGNRPLVNIGNMQNTGIDANITYHGGSARGLKYDLTGTFTSYNNKIVSIPGSGYFSTGGSRHGDLVRNQVGQAVGAFYGYEVLGLFQSDEDVSKSPTQSGAAPGRFKFRDISGADGKPDGKIDANDRTFFGNPNPDFTYGLNISVSYKNFDFSTFLFGSYGNDLLNYTKYFTDFPQLFKGGIRREAAVNAWRPDNTISKIPKLEFASGFSTTENNSTYFLEKGSYLRDKQMQVGYTLPNSGLTRFGIDRLRVYIQAANLFTITKYSGLDPELQSVNPNAGANDPAQVTFGIDYGNYPHQRSFIVGVNLGF
ncbi:MAG: SusC/RagA family TonB-linked outer membrane protein [Segetibacter sp.]